MKYKTKKELQNWLKRNGYNDIKVYRNNEFEFNYNDNAIGVSDSMTELFFEDFANMVSNELHLSQDMNIASLYFLHELGHYNTEDDFSQASEKRYIRINKVLDLLMKIPSDRVAKGVNKYYQRLPQEYSATRWAVRFVRKHPKQAKSLDKIFEKI